MTRYINFCQTGYPPDRKVVISVSDVERRIPIQYVANPQELDIHITTMAKGVPIKLSQFHGRVFAKDLVFKSFGLRLMCFESSSEGRCHSIVELGRSKDYPSGKKSFATIEVTRFTLSKLFALLEKQISFELECRGIPSRDFMQSSNLCYQIAFHRQDLWRVSHGVWPNCVNIGQLKIEFPNDAHIIHRAEVDIDQLKNKLYAEVSNKSETVIAGNSLTTPSGPCLTPNDRYILQAMLALDANRYKPEKGDTIVRLATYSGDSKRAFQRLLGLHLVESKTGRCGGYWLTEKGLEVANKLVSNSATNSPTDCSN
jgi:hypothetical protein